VVEVYPHTKLDGNRKNFLWTYGRTDTPEFQCTRSSPRRWPNKNWVAKYSDFGHIEGYISEMVQDRR